MNRRHAQGGEAHRAETGTGSVHEHPVAEGEAPGLNLQAPAPTQQTGEGQLSRARAAGIPVQGEDA